MDDTKIKYQIQLRVKQILNTSDKQYLMHFSYYDCCYNLFMNNYIVEVYIKFVE